MGFALLEGWIRAGLVSAAAPAYVIEPNPHEALRTRIKSGLAVLVAPPLRADPKPKLIVLAVKPQTAEAAVKALRPLANDSAFISIVAGKTITWIGATLSETMPPPIIRAMPNLPASVGAGVTAAVAGPRVDDVLKQQADSLLRAVGEVVWIDDETLIDAVTAVSGSGPAYVFNLVEALAAGGVAAGLPRAAADKLARETIIGAAALLKAGKETPEELRRAVTSPGGTTEAALSILMSDRGLTPLMRDAVTAALDRARELGKA
jgi:pyrroline-5-carboxylate reductase